MSSYFKAAGISLALNIVLAALFAVMQLQDTTALFLAILVAITTSGILVAYLTHTLLLKQRLLKTLDRDAIDRWRHNLPADIPSIPTHLQFPAEHRFLQIAVSEVFFVCLVFISLEVAFLSSLIAIQILLVYFWLEKRWMLLEYDRFVRMDWIRQKAAMKKK